MDLLTEQPCVTLTIDDPVLQQCYRLRVPGVTSEDGYAFLERLDSGLAGTGARQLLAGATWGPIRRRYEAYDRALAEAAKARLTSLGSNPTLAELEAVVRHASAQRTTAARLWRLPSGPDAFLAAEVRDWAEYGLGGRRFGNLMSRSMKNPRQTSWSQADHLRNIASKVGKTNAETTSGVFRSARFLKTGGAIVMMAGLGWTYHEYQNTPEHLKADFLKREAVSAAGGALASGLVTAFLVTTTAAGVVVVGVGLVAGIAGALAAEGIYRSIYGDSLLGQIRNSGVIQANLLRNR
jgi:hypothetical protein